MISRRPLDCPPQDARHWLGCISEAGGELHLERIRPLISFFPCKGQLQAPACPFSNLFQPRDERNKLSANEALLHGSLCPAAPCGPLAAEGGAPRTPAEAGVGCQRGLCCCFSSLVAVGAVAVLGWMGEPAEGALRATQHWDLMLIRRQAGHVSAPEGGLRSAGPALTSA